MIDSLFVNLFLRTILSKLNSKNLAIHIVLKITKSLKKYFTMFMFETWFFLFQIKVFGNDYFVKKLTMKF